MRWLVGLVVVVLAAIGLSREFRTDPLQSALNRQWPPISADDQRQTAVATTSAALTDLSPPNFAAGISLDSLQAFASGAAAPFGITTLKLIGVDQLVQINADFDVTFKPGDLPTSSSENQALLTTLHPHVVGHIEFLLGVAATLDPEQQGILNIKLLPALHRVRASKVEIGPSHNITEAVTLLTLLLNKYGDNITAALTRSALATIHVPTLAPNTFDPTRQVRLNLREIPDLTVHFSGHPVASPYRLSAIALLVDSSQIDIMAQLVTAPTFPHPGGSGASSFADIQTRFQAALASNFGIQTPPTGAWIALSKPFIAESLNRAFAQSQLCVAANGTIPPQHFAAKIPTPDPSSIDCTPHQECSQTTPCDLQVDRRDCRRPRNCSHNHDTRDCKACLLRAPRICVFDKCTGGQCVQSGNDPICEASKAAQNAAYDTAFNACNALGPIDDALCETEKAGQNGAYVAAKGTCETTKEGRRIACEGEKTSKKLTCEGEKGIIDGLHRTGNVADLNGSVTGPVQLSTCFQNVNVASDMTHVSATLQTSGSADMETHFKFTPLDVAGHILCPLPWTADKHINASLPRQPLNVQVSLAAQMANGELTYNGRVDELPIKLHFHPSPLSMVLQNINFALACPPAAGLVNGLTLNLAPFIPEFLKEFSYTVHDVAFSFTPNIPDATLYRHHIQPRLSETGRALLVSVSP